MATWFHLVSSQHWVVHTIATSDIAATAALETHWQSSTSVYLFARDSVRNHQIHDANTATTPLPSIHDYTVVRQVHCNTRQCTLDREDGTADVHKHGVDLSAVTCHEAGHKRDFVEVPDKRLVRCANFRLRATKWGCWDLHEVISMPKRDDPTIGRLHRDVPVTVALPPRSEPRSEQRRANASGCTITARLLSKPGSCGTCTSSFTVTLQHESRTAVARGVDDDSDHVPCSGCFRHHPSFASVSYPITRP